MSTDPQQQQRTHGQPQAPLDGYSKVKAKLRKFGPAMIAIGGLMLLIGVGQFFWTIISVATAEPFSRTDNGFPILFVILGIPGAMILSLGMMVTQAGYLKEITTYGAKETTPAVTIATTAVRAAILDDDIPCSTCSTPIEPDSKFCSSCGHQVNALQCPSCEHPIDSATTAALTSASINTLDWVPDRMLAASNSCYKKSRPNQWTAFVYSMMLVVR